METLDLRNLACPEPVLRTRNAIAAHPGSVFEALVNHAATLANVTRMARALGAQVVSEELDSGEYRLTISTPPAPVEEAPLARAEPCEVGLPKGRATVFIKNNVLGLGDDRLGRILMKAFLKTLQSADPLPAEIICVNNGVHLTTAGSEELATLGELAEKGVEVVSCGTCLDFFGKLDKVRVGGVVDMLDIVTRLNRAAKIITP